MDVKICIKKVLDELLAALNDRHISSIEARQVILDVIQDLESIPEEIKSYDKYGYVKNALELLQNSRKHWSVHYSGEFMHIYGAINYLEMALNE